ncbi:MAG: hypothetical protein ACOY7J_02260 [Pseudomonadota bacterium]
MSTKSESWQRLRNAAWCNDPGLAKINDGSARFQRISEGAGPYNYDEYSVVVNSFPRNLTPIKYLKEFAMNLNAAVDNFTFNAANVFTKRDSSRLRVGDIWDIDFLGPDNGSIILVALSDNFGREGISSWFDIQTIECRKYGTHPECGAREFGFEVVSGGTKYYTRGVSRAYLQFHRTGAPVQRQSWISMLEGIAATLIKRGAVIRNTKVAEEQVSR